MNVFFTDRITHRATVTGAMATARKTDTIKTFMIVFVGPVRIILESWPAEVHMGEQR